MYPFANPKLIRQNIKRATLVKRKLAPPGDKASLRAAAAKAEAEHLITRIPTRKRALPPATDW